MTGVLYVYCNNAEPGHRRGSGRTPEQRRRGVIARARRLLHAALAYRRNTPPTARR